MTGRLALVAAVVIAGCGTPSADLFVVHRTGTVPGAAFTLVVGDGGTVTCNGTRRSLPDRLLLVARQIQRDLSKPATEGVQLRPGPRPVFAYAVTTPAGRIGFADDSPGVIPVMYQVAGFTRQVARSVCGLVR